MRGSKIAREIETEQKFEKEQKKKLLMKKAKERREKNNGYD